LKRPQTSCLLALLGAVLLTACGTSGEFKRRNPGSAPDLSVRKADVSAQREQTAKLIRWYDSLSAAEREAACRKINLTVENHLPPDGRMVRFGVASDFSVRKLKQRCLRPGVGLPILTWRENDNSGAWDAYRPLGPVFQTATAVLDIAPGGGGRPRLRFFSPMQHETVFVNGREQPLAADFTALFAAMAEAGPNMKKMGVRGMLQPVSVKDPAGVKFLEPYDPKRIPILFTHGLQSTPSAFANLANDLLADPFIRKHCQLWAYYYPTGRPVLSNATQYRQIFRDTLKAVDPDRNDFATHHILLIGHSMGGVISHSLVSDSGWHLWDSVLDARPTAMTNTPPQTIAALKDSLLFQRDPRITRIIFIACPHRGSALADNWIGNLGQWLFRPDLSLYAIFAPLIDSSHIGSFYLDLLRQGKPSSIRTLSPRAPDLPALAARPIPIPYHSIIGQKKTGPRLQGTDGVVPYTSSHLPGAASELVVPCGHNAYRHPEAVKEINRIVHVHIRSSGLSSADRHP